MCKLHDVGFRYELDEAGGCLYDSSQGSHSVRRARMRRQRPPRDTSTNLCRFASIGAEHRHATPGWKDGRRYSGTILTGGLELDYPTQNKRINSVVRRFEG